MSKYVHIYMEANPNPASLKFVVNEMLVPDGTDFHFEALADAETSPLAKMLFGFDFVDKVFIMSNFVTVTKKAEYEWDEVGKLVREALTDHLAKELPVLDIAKLQSNLAPEESDTDTIRKVKDVLEEYIRPAVEGDGGAINFHSFDEITGLVKVQLRGSCAGCPSSTITLKQGIETLLKRMIPEVKAVEAEAAY